jgi:hypothetical protein
MEQILLEKLVKKFLTFYGRRRYISVFRRAHIRLLP